MYISILETNCYTIYIIFASFNFSIKKERGKKEIPRPERLHLLYPRHLIFLYRTKKISKINLNPRTVGYIHSSSSPLQHPRHLIFSHSPMKRKNSKDQSLKKNYSHPVHLIFPSRYAKKKKKKEAKEKFQRSTLERCWKPARRHRCRSTLSFLPNCIYVSASHPRGRARKREKEREREGRQSEEKRACRHVLTILHYDTTPFTPVPFSFGGHPATLEPTLRACGIAVEGSRLRKKRWRGEGGSDPRKWDRK